MRWLRHFRLGRPRRPVGVPLEVEVERLATQSAWSDVARRTADLAPTASRLIILRTIAGIELDDEAVIGSCVELCLGGAVDPRTTLAVAQRLIAVRRTAPAWRLLSELKLPGDRSLRVLLKRLASRAGDTRLRMAALERHAALDPGQPATPRDAAEPWVPVPDAAGPREDAGSGFQLAFINQGRVAASRDGEYRDHMARFDRALATLRPPRIREFKDVLVNRFGQIWRADGTVIRGCNRPLPDESAIGEAEAIDEAILSADATRGFYHWYAERLPALAWRLAPDAPDLPILFGRHAGPFQDETLRLLGVPASRIHRIGDAIHCRRVLVSELSVGNLTQWSLFDTLYGRLGAPAPGAETPRMIYISRRDTDRRRLVNEPELERALSDLGIVPLVFGALSLAAQIAAVRGAELIVAPHGAGLAHVLAHRPGLPILELHPTQSGSHHLRLSFVRLSRVRGHHHTLWLEPINPVTKEWSVDVPGVVAAASAMQRDLAQDATASGRATGGA